MNPDETLIIQAELHASGADIYRLKNIISVYKLSCYSYNLGGSVKAKHAAEKAETDLRKLIYESQR